MVVAHAKYCRVYDLSPIVNSRQRRQIVGEFTLSPLDILCGRTFPDTIVTARSNFDSHGYTVHPVFALKPPDRRVLLAHVPYRCLLPRGLDGILVLGLGVSTHRDAMPIIRMQPDIQNQGYAAGLAAVAAVRAGTTVRQINVRALQQQLATAGVLNREVLQHEDSFPLPTPEIEAAVRRVANDFDGVAAVLTAPELARPLLRRAYVTAADEGSRLIYAQILATLGDDTGTDALVRAVRSRDWDEGWNFTGMGQFGRSMSPVDDLLVALGRTGSDSAVEPVLEKLRLLNGEHAFSHFRAIAMALEVRGDPRAGAPLAELLSRPGIRGHAFLDIEDAIRRTPRTVNDNTTRNLALRELVIARALYRCGDPDGVGATVLREYARDLRAHFANHARAVLAHEARRRSGIPGHAAEGPH